MPDAGGALADAINAVARIARAIADENSFITADVIAEFCKKLGR